LDLDLGDAGDIGLDLSLSGRTGFIGVSTVQTIEVPEIDVLKDLPEEVVAKLNIPTTLPIGASVTAKITTPRDLLDSADLDKYSVTECSLDLDYSQVTAQNEYFGDKIQEIIGNDCQCWVTSSSLPIPGVSVTCGQVSFSFSEQDGFQFGGLPDDIDFSDFPIPDDIDIFDIVDLPDVDVIDGEVVVPEGTEPLTDDDIPEGVFEEGTFAPVLPPVPAEVYNGGTFAPALQDVLPPSLKGQQIP